MVYRSRTTPLPHDSSVEITAYKKHERDFKQFVDVRIPPFAPLKGLKQPKRSPAVVTKYSTHFCDNESTQHQLGRIFSWLYFFLFSIHTHTHTHLWFHFLHHNHTFHRFSLIPQSSVLYCPNRSYSFRRLLFSFFLNVWRRLDDLNGKTLNQRWLVALRETIRKTTSILSCPSSPFRSGGKFTPGVVMGGGW